MLTTLREQSQSSASDSDTYEESDPLQVTGIGLLLSSLYAV